MKDSGPFDIDAIRYVLAPDGEGIPRPVTSDFYPALDREYVVPDFYDAAQGGSNNWAVAGAHTSSGAPVLAGDSHQGIAHPLAEVKAVAGAPLRARLPSSAG